MNRRPVLVFLAMIVGMAGAADAASISVSSTAPTVDGADVAMLNTTGAYDIGGNQGHIWANRPVQGQTFTTGGNLGGYTLSSVTLQSRQTRNDGGVFPVRVGLIAGNRFLPVASESFSKAPFSANDYLTAPLSSAVSLIPNTVYGFDWGSTSGGFITNNNADSNYPGGSAYSSGANSVGDGTVTIHSGPNTGGNSGDGDRVFHADLTAAAPAPSSNGLSVNFAGGSSGDFGPHNVTGVAGAVPLANWNNVVGAAWNNPDVSGAPLVDSSGAATGATMWIDASNTWASGANTSTDDGRMMKGYIDNAQGQFISLFGLGAPFTSHGFEVLVYYDTDSDGAFNIQIDDNLGNSASKWAYELSGSYPLGSPSGFIESFANSQAEALAALNSGNTSNFVRLKSLSGQNLFFTLTNGSTPFDDRARITGFQIIAIPEPTTLLIWSLFAGLGVGLGWRRRK